MICLLALSLQSEADLARSRFVGFISGANTLSVDIRVSHNMGPDVGVGQFVYSKPQRLMFRVKGGQVDYKFVSTERHILEIEHGSKTYSEMPSVHRLIIPQSEISEVTANAFPAPVLTGELRMMIPPDQKFKHNGKVTLKGVPNDHLSCEFMAIGGRSKIDVYIAPDGSLSRIVGSDIGSGGTFARTIDLSNYRLNTSIPEPVFQIRIPDGYVPHSLPPTAGPAIIGSKPQLAGISRAGKAVDLKREAGGKPMVLIITGSDCAPSRQARPTLEALQKQASAGGAAVFWLSHGSASASGFTATDRTLDELDVPGTPAVFLIGKDGTALRTWYGFDSSIAGTLGKEVAEELKKEPAE